MSIDWERRAMAWKEAAKDWKLAHASLKRDCEWLSREAMDSYKMWEDEMLKVARLEDEIERRNEASRKLRECERSHK